jgi:hypothetical protein
MLSMHSALPQPCRMRWGREASGTEISMQIPKEQAEKLKRYFINADPFLWGVLGAKNKRKCLMELKKHGLLQSYSEHSSATYAKIKQDLLVELGIDGILQHIVVPRVRSVFSIDVLRYFRRCWDQGQNPDVKYLIERKLYRKRILTSDEVGESIGFKISTRAIGKVSIVVGHKDPASLFVEINRQFDFVERWTVFAGLWFEEIEPLLSTM